MSKEQLFFHVRNDDNKDDHLLTHTICFKKQDNTILIGYSILHANDNFCRKSGRDLSAKKVEILERIETKCFKQDYESSLPYSVSTSLEKIIVKVADIFKLQGDVKVKTFIHNNKTKIPVIMTYKV